MRRWSMPPAVAAPLLVIGLACGDSDEPIPPLPADGDEVRFYRVVDDVLHCFHVEADAPFGEVFRDNASWAEFWEANVTCADDEEVPRPPPDFDWENYVVITVVSEGPCVYSGCWELMPMIPAIDVEGETLRVLTRKPTQEEIGTCLACMQPRDVVQIDRYLDDAFPIQFSFETWDAE